jgi:beta-ribofuranosylaminobenzene 5'-phosphate synthase
MILEAPMILEGIVITTNADGGANIAPMGPSIEDGGQRLVFRPFQTSTTYANLKRSLQGVLHVIDDVELLARAAIGQLDPPPSLLPVKSVDGFRLADCCHWRAFRVTTIDDRQPRAQVEAIIVDQGRVRDSFGLNRAKHAVLEASILATRVAILPADELREQFQRLSVLVDKTGGPAEKRAFDLLTQYVRLARPPTKVRVAANSRLHFGMFSFGQSDQRSFGGVGAMIDHPALELELSLADRWTASGPLADRTLHFAQRAAKAWGSPDRPPCHIEVLNAPPAHAGLGTGTQLALAAAAGLRLLWGLPNLPVTDLALSVGRAGRSAIGTHGFALGGLLVESGKRRPDACSPLVARLDLPTDWRFLLLRPLLGAGLAGEEERRAFDRLPPVAPEVTAGLAEETLLRLLPAAAEADFDAFADSLDRFNRIAGQCFAAAQGGPFARPDLIQLLGDLGGRGLGQSSWGPTLFAVAPNEPSAVELGEQIRSDPRAAGCQIDIARPANSGATVIAG